MLIRLATELTDKELTRRLHDIEEYLFKTMQELSRIQTPTQRSTLFRKRELVLIRYAETLNELYTRELLTLH